MKVMLLTNSDHSNTGWRFSKCLEYLGYNVKTFKRIPHAFKYPNQMDIYRYSKIQEDFFLKKIAGKSDVLHFFASTFVDTGINLENKNVVVNHNGSIYKNHTKKINEMFNNIVDFSIIQFPGLLGLGAKNECLIYFPVDTDFITPVFNDVKKKLIVGHFPSNPKNKGTLSIYNTVKDFDNIKYIGKKDEKLKVDNIKWTDNLERMSKCDIIIERMNTRNGKYGEWGNTALEAAALGKIVITNTLSKEIYNKEYGELPLLICNTEKELRETLNNLTSLSNKEILELKHKMREWAENKHSISATAKRLYDKVYKNFER